MNGKENQRRSGAEEKFETAGEGEELHRVRTESAFELKTLRAEEAGAKLETGIELENLSNPGSSMLRAEVNTNSPAAQELREGSIFQPAGVSGFADSWQPEPEDVVAG